MAQTALRRGSQEEGNSEYFTGCPIGGGFIWYGLPEKIPTNCRICDNSTLAVSQFAKLYEVMDGAWGASGGNINLPDLRGRFPRGVDGGVGNDPDRASRTFQNTGQNTGDTVGSVQNDTFQNIRGEFLTREGYYGGQTTAGTGAFNVASTASGTYGTKPDDGRNYLSVSFDASRVARTSTETRPKNANVYFVIRVS